MQNSHFIIEHQQLAGRFPEALNARSMCEYIRINCLGPSAEACDGFGDNPAACGRYQKLLSMSTVKRLLPLITTTDMYEPLILWFHTYVH